MRRVTALLFAALLFAGVTAEARADEPVVVIVHGAWGGGWAFRDVEKKLEARGFDVYRPTLTGQGGRAHLASPDVNLDTHITDIVSVLRYEELTDVVLVGHSYGGYVVTGVADREPERIRKLIYLDAMIPVDGESWYSVSGEGGRKWIDENTKDHGLHAPWVDPDAEPPADVPHPTGTIKQPIQLTGAFDSVPAEYILTADNADNPDDDDFAAMAAEARDRGWPTHVLEADHNPQWSAVDDLVDMLATLAGNTE